MFVKAGKKVIFSRICVFVILSSPDATDVFVNRNRFCAARVRKKAANKKVCLDKKAIYLDLLQWIGKSIAIDEKRNLVRYVLFAVRTK